MSQQGKSGDTEQVPLGAGEAHSTPSLLYTVYTVYLPYHRVMLPVQAMLVPRLGLKPACQHQPSA